MGSLDQILWIAAKASGNGARRMKLFGLPQYRSIAFLMMVAAAAPSAALAQSGRRQPSADPVVIVAPVKGTGRPRTTTEPPATNSNGQQGKSTPPASKHDNGEVSSDDVIRVTSNLVSVPASVVDANGVAVSDLKLSDFQLFVDGEPKPISDLFRSDMPVRLAMLFDNSTSLTSSRELEKQAAVRFFRRVMRSQDQAAIYNVYDEIVLAQPFTSDVHALVRTIENFGKPEGATSLFDAIAESAKYLTSTTGRRVIVIVSDGADTTSNLDFDTTLRAAQAADCQIYVVQTGQTMNANVRDLMAERRMEDFAAQTGGAVYVPHSNSDLDRAFDQISADLATQYVVSYYPKDDVRDGRLHILSLTVPSRPTVRVRARRGFYSPKEKKA
jgi:Ca-activated chloride channel family protein